MGTEMLYPIGTVLKRKDKKGDNMDEVHVIGGGAKLIVESRLEFSGAQELDVVVAREQYDADLPEGTELSMPAFTDPGPTPEQVFAAADRKQRTDDEAAGKPKRERTIGHKKAEEKTADA